MFAFPGFSVLIIGCLSPLTLHGYSYVTCLEDNKSSGNTPLVMLNAVIITQSTHRSDQSSLLSSSYVTWANMYGPADSLLLALKVPVSYSYNGAEFDHHYAYICS